MRCPILLSLLPLLLTACGQNGDAPAAEATTPVQSLAATLPAAPAPAAPREPTAMPTTQSQLQHYRLLSAIAGSTLYARQLRRKDADGLVVPPGKQRDFEQAQRSLARIKANLARLSSSGPSATGPSSDTLPTFLLIHNVDEHKRLVSWLIGPDGGIVSGFSAEAYDGLGRLNAGLGVTRLSATRGPRAEGAPPPSMAIERAAKARDQSPAAMAERGRTLEWTAGQLLPGPVGQALGSRTGRLLVIAAQDSGAAPYAALPLANGVAARNWSFILLPDIEAFAGSDGAFDFDALDVNKAVVLGDPDLSKDREYDWDELKGARREAVEAARTFDDPSTVLRLGTDATRRNFVRDINAHPDAGIIYMATHAVADPKNPLTRGFIAMADTHYYAGHVRQARFNGWDRHHPLVVMSACQTALGRVLQGGGFGVARTWYTAGAGQVVASLWNVSDRATYILMHHFVKRLKAGEPPEIALQQAQIATMTYSRRDGTRPYADDPKMWASFAVYGLPSG